MQDPADPRLTALLPLVRGLAEMLGPDCEVVLHDLGRLPHTIVAIENGHVTGRRVGDVPTDLMLSSLRNIDGLPDTRVYMTSRDGKTLRSLAVTLRDDEKRPLAILGVNLDVSRLAQAQRAMSVFTGVAAPAGPTGPSNEEIFAGDIREVVAGMIAKIVAEMGKTPAAMTREEKMRVVKRLEERGAFLVKRSAEQVAEALDLSRYTIFSYLKEIRRPAVARATAPGGIGDDRFETRLS